MSYAAGTRCCLTKRITLIVALLLLFCSLAVSKHQRKPPLSINREPAYALPAKAVLGSLQQSNTGNNGRHTNQETKRKQTVIASPSRQNLGSAMRTVELRMRCGVNCLYLITRRYKIDITYNELLALLEPSHVGVSMLILRDVAEQLGLETMAIELQPQYILRFRNPMIALLMSKNGAPPRGHFVIVVPMAKKGGFWMLDPPHKKKWITKEQLIQEGVQNIPVLIFRPKIKTRSDLSNESRHKEQRQLNWRFACNIEPERAHNC